ncbi:putative protocadherin Fat 1 [Apostichopus japonicus]|uniref:Putative protocadherin Fat 1 n=1 Tax=Stichopus japonicus TaxID=307972 RepID=A0A2G8JX27_STIJA|nr:putative protocadherin Fat 1 [Apostichopus japonicus]
MTVELQDGGVPHLSSTCDLVVEVIDVNENLHPPVFPDFVITASVEENAEVGREVIAVTATDMDEGRDGEISYFIRGGSGLGMFMVDKFGIIRTKAVLDRESQSHYWLTVYAQDNAAVPLHSIVEVYIQVSDVNEMPLPDSSVFRGYIPENSAAGTDIIRVEVEDLDETESQNITFEIPSKKIRRMFQIDRTTGMISTANSRLDREVKSSYLFDVDVSDNGDPAHTSTANVIIEILDVNDNAPVFHQMNYGKVPVRPVELVGDEQHTILRVFAYDDDEGENATVSYVIPTGQDRQTRFGVDAQTGEVKCSRSLVEGESFTLMIDAFDNGPIQEKSRLTLLLTVIDPIEPSSLAPVFDEFFSDPLYENVAPGTFVTTVFASDYDSNSNDVIYTITGGNHDAAFTNQQSAIFVAKPLDAETRTSYDLEITASDGFNTATSILHLDVLDANEFAPVFGHDQYEVSVPENIASGKKILQLDVTDRDVTSRLFYSISSTAHPDSKSRFKINSDTGEIYVRNPLDHEGIRQHILTVKVRDVGHISFHSFTTVVVTVLDFNDHMPYFGADHYEGQVFETAETGTVVVHVQGYDNDKDVNAELEYSILSGNKEDAFYMDPVLGNIMTTRELNIEDQAKYSLRVQVMDHGTPSLSNTATVNITVVLSNSAPPRFVQDEFITELEENLSPGQFVLHPDVISKSSVFFDIAGGNERDHFEIDSSSGVVLSKLPLDFEMVEVYNLTIEAVNMVGGSAFAHLIIHVLDVNDNAPLFIQEVYEGTITESSPMNTVVSDEDNHHLVVGAIDLDFDQNARLVYSIVEEDAAQYFVIDENTGAIRSLMSLDHETHPTFEFHVTVHDSGSQILSARNPALVKVTVQDINDSPPVFVEEDYEASLLLPTFEDVLVSQMVATDPDSVSLSNLYYSIRAGNAGSHFKIKPTTGEILVAEPQRIEGRYHLQVEVSDGLHTSQTQVRIITKQTASSDLQFRSNQTDATVVENSTGITYIAQVAVVGTGLNEPVAYTILNPTNCFSINARSGSLRTTGIPLDRETKDQYMLVVEARDDRRPPRIARTVVFVEVTDVNDNSPVFVHHEYNAIVQVDARVGEIVRTVLALDADDGSNGEVEYTLMGGAEGYFDIDPVSGDITVQNVMGLDVENRNFTLLVQASDKGVESRSLSKDTKAFLSGKRGAHLVKRERKKKFNVEVPIIVRNKAMPVFREQYYSASIPEDIQLFSSVVQIEAISPSGRKLIYSVSNGNPYKHFDITPLTGSLDYETQNRYTLTVQASDTLTGGPHPMHVDIAVDDVNDMAPRFPMQVYHKVLSEGFPVSSTVLQLSATDQDSDAFNKIRYSLETDSDEVSSLFRVDASSGILFTLKQLDHETADSFNFTVVASVMMAVPP